MEPRRIKVKLPIEVNVDNVGVIFLAKNKNRSERTKHVDTRYHYVRQLIVCHFIEVAFVPSEESIANIFTKNLYTKSYLTFQEISCMGYLDLTQLQTGRVLKINVSMMIWNQRKTANKEKLVNKSKVKEKENSNRAVPSHC
jgi:hypothetical protein